MELFTGGSLTDVDFLRSQTAPLAITAGATGWMQFATRVGLPVSTTHALVGALLAGGIAAGGTSAIHWSALLGAIILPLAVGPILALMLSLLISGGLGRRFHSLPLQHLQGLHVVSATAMTAARGFNDSPKLGGIGLLALTPIAPTVGVSSHTALLLVLVLGAMVLGGVLASTRVMRTLAERVVELDAATGLAANSASSLLVTAGAVAGFPLSTTHITGAALVGAGLDHIQWSIVGQILAVWVLTVPGAFALTWLLWLASHALG